MVVEKPSNDYVMVPRELLAALIDPDPCWFDHHGGCQAHGYLGLQLGEVCPNEEARLRYDGAWPDDS